MTTTNTIKCPITGKLIPENEFDTHIKPCYVIQDIKRTRKLYTEEFQLCIQYYN